MPFAECGLAAVAVGSAEAENAATKKWGYINTDGEFVIQPTLELATTFCADLAAVYRDGRYAYINTQGQTQFELAADCLMAGRFTDDGYAILLCDDPDAQSPLYDYVTVIDENGKALHTHRILTVNAELLVYAVTP